MRKILTLLLIGASVCSPAESLKDYKSQKHRQLEKGPDNKVVTKTCEQAYLETCQAGCGNTAACQATCRRQVGPYCEQRAKEQAKAEGLILLEAICLLVGPAATFFDSPKHLSGDDGNSPYTFLWDVPSFNLDLGAGLLQGGAYSYSLAAGVRYGYFGLGGNAAYLNQGGDFLGEYDIGPRFYLGSAHLDAAIQPSFLGSVGNGVKPEYGWGIRSDTTVHLDRIYLVFSPLLGEINSQWLFQLRAGIGYRFNSIFGMHVAFEHRSLIDLQTLSVNQASLNGGSLYFSLRYN